MMRLDKFLVECKLGTRTEVKQKIKSGFIKVNDVVVKKPEIKVDEFEDVITVSGKQLVYEKFVYFLFHKPAGCVTAKKDNLHKTVMDYFPSEIAKDCSPVGRLDLDTEGVLLITNDGELNHHLISPSHHVKKKYSAKLDKPVPADTIDLFHQGIDIGDDKPTLPAKLEFVNNDSNSTEVYLTIEEGRFHQVKRMFQAVGCKVIYLKRESMGNLSLGNLAIGEYRKLLPEEVEELRR